MYRSEPIYSPFDFTQVEQTLPQQRFLRPENLHKRFDDAATLGNIEELYRVGMIMRDAVEYSGQLNLERITMLQKSASLPLYEYVHALKEGFEPGPALGEQVDDVYPALTAILQQSLEAREAQEPASDSYKQFTGAITQLIIQSILTRNGQFSNFIPIPTTNKEDMGSRPINNLSNAIDFWLYPPDEPLSPIRSQVKTSFLPSGHEDSRHYSPDILVIILAGLQQGKHKGSDFLARSLIHDADDTATPDERRAIGFATMKLTRKIYEHRIKLLET